MSIKIGLASKIVWIGLLVMSVAGCKNDNSSGEVTLSSDARVLSFVLTDNGSVASSLASYVFSIEQKNSPSIIENNDSLPVGTNINRNLLATIAFNGASDVKVVYIDGSRETKSYVSTDSINFANDNIRLEVMAANGSTKKIYHVKVNVHKEDPEAMSWRKVAGLAPMRDQVSFDEGVTHGFASFYKEGTVLKKYSYSTGAEYSISIDANISSILQETRTERYALLDAAGKIFLMNRDGSGLQDKGKSADRLFGYVWGLENLTDEALYLIYSFQGKLYALNTNTGKTYERTFPDGSRLDAIDSFVRVNNIEDSRFYNHLIVAGHVPGEANTCVYDMYIEAFEENNEFNAELVCMAYSGQNKVRYLPSLKAPVLFDYRGLLFAIGGQKNDGTFTKDVYVSRDMGINWEKQTKKLTMDGADGFTARRGMSVAVRDGKHIYLFGGEVSPLNYSSEVWKGKINKVDHSHVFPAK